MPPSVFRGEMVNFIGRFITMNGGKDFWVSDAVPFQGKFSKILEPIHQYLWQYCDDPREWATPDRLPILKIENYN